MLERALPKVNAHELAGATLILGCYGGMDTFSDLIIGKAYESGEPLKYQNLNARLTHLRTRTFAVKLYKNALCQREISGQVAGKFQPWIVPITCRQRAAIRHP